MRGLWQSVHLALGHRQKAEVRAVLALVSILVYEVSVWQVGDVLRQLRIGINCPRLLVKLFNLGLDLFPIF
jgi:hypothetical protein